MSSHGHRRYWFTAKRYGFGWGLPITWQGWVVSFVYLVAIVVLSFVLDLTENVFPFVGSVMVMTSVFLAICWKKGEPLKWRWGKAGDDSESKLD